MKHLVLYRDLVPSADGRNRLLGVFNSLQEARSAILVDVDRYCNAFPDVPLTTEETEAVISVKIGLDEYLCDWEIVPVI